MKIKLPEPQNPILLNQHFMSALPKALQYLAELQSKAEALGEIKAKRSTEDEVFRIIAGDANYADSRLSPDRWEALHKFYSQEVSSLKPILPETQSVTEYFILKNIKDDFDQLIRNSFHNPQEYNTSSKVYFGTLESIILNAMIFPVPDSDEYLVVINRGLWLAAQVLAYVTAASLEFPDYPVPNDFDEARAAANVNLFGEMVSLALGKSCRIEYPSVDTHTPQNYYWERLDGSVKDFIFGHEYGHFLHNHFGRDADEKHAGVVLGKVEYSVSTTSWENEYDADRVGLDLAVFKSRERLVGASGDIASSLGGLIVAEGILMGVEGSLLFLNLLCQIERLKGVICTPESSHPPTWMRIQKIWGTLRRQIPDAGTFEFAKRRLMPAGQCFQYFFDRLSHDENPLSAERVLQDTVFQSLFEFRRSELITELKEILGALRDHSGASKDASSPAGTFRERCLQLLTLMIKKYDVSPARCREMVQNCIAVIEKDMMCFT